MHRPARALRKVIPDREKRPGIRVVPRHLVYGEGEAVGDGGHMIYFVELEHPALARLQIFVEHPMAADVEIPHGLRHRRENLRLVVATACCSGE